MPDASRDTGKISLSERVPLWLLLVGGIGGLGGLGLGGAQLARSPSDLGDKIDGVSAQVAVLNTNVATLASEMKARDKADDRERTRHDDEMRQIRERLSKVEERQRGIK